MSSPRNDNLREQDLCFLDVETTGSVFGYHEIVDIAAVRTVPDASTILGKWHKRIRPRHPERFSSYARDLNGYTPELWAGAEESTAPLWNEFVTFVKDCVPVCHNPSFDRAFITLAAAEHDILELGLDYHWIGTESLAWPLYKQGVLPSLSLESLCTFFEVGVEPRPHTALDGALACWRVYQVLMGRQTDRRLSGWLRPS
ncbi:MAG: 3'-5' exonuclease [Deltaproteobacteria bacterium]|nr:3'-5' exonuclease [Deltaproteobacteria bacterium]